MEDLSDRQTEILKTILEEYMEEAEPVGSQKLEKKYSLGVSPATIRNEMAELTQKGYLKQPHTSAGRIPTKKAFRFYISQLMEEKKLSVTEEVAAKEKVWDSRFNFEQLLKQATRSLADQSRALALAATDQGEVFHSGYAHLLESPEFYDIDITRTILSMLDESQTLMGLFKKSFGEEAIHYLFGEELGYDFLEPCGMVFTHFQAGPKMSGYLGVVGPSRFYYPRIVPLVRYYAQLIEELAQGL